MRIPEFEKFVKDQQKWQEDLEVSIDQKYQHLVHVIRGLSWIVVVSTVIITIVVSWN